MGRRCSQGWELGREQPAREGKAADGPSGASRRARDASRPKSRQGASATKGAAREDPELARARRPPRRRARPAWLTALASRIQGAWLALLKAVPRRCPEGATARPRRATRRARDAKRARRSSDLSRTDLVWAAATGGRRRGSVRDGPDQSPSARGRSRDRHRSQLARDPARSRIHLVRACRQGVHAARPGRQRGLPRQSVQPRLCLAVRSPACNCWRAGAGPAAGPASLGALTLAAGAGFWFYAGFAKHDMFSGLLFLVALHLTLAWQQRPSDRHADRAGGGARRRAGLIVAADGAARCRPWPSSCSAGRGRLSLPSLAYATATGLVILVALGGFVMVRAAQNPAVNFDDPTSISRLVELVTRADFTPHSVPLTTDAAGRRGGASPPANATGASSASWPRAPSGAVAARSNRRLSVPRPAWRRRLRRDLRA